MRSVALAGMAGDRELSGIGRPPGMESADGMGVGTNAARWEVEDGER